MYGSYETTENLESLENLTSIISPTMILGILAAFVVTYIGMMLVFKKAGKKWYESLVPGHSLYAMFEIAGMSGANFFLLMVPIVNIVIIFKLYIKTAKAFGKGAGFGLGLLFLPTLFFLILGIDRSQHFSQTNRVNEEPISNPQNNVVPGVVPPVNNVENVFEKKAEEQPPQPVVVENVAVNNAGVDAPPIVNAPISAAGPMPTPPIIEAPVVAPPQPQMEPNPAPPQPKSNFIEPPPPVENKVQPNNKIDPFNINNKS